MKEDKKYFLIYNRPEYEAGINARIFDFTIEDIERAENSDNGLVGCKNGIDFYISKNIPASK